MIEGITVYNFFVEMAVAVLLFTVHLPQKPHFILRMGFTITVIGIVWYLLLFVVPDPMITFTMLKYILLFWCFVVGTFFLWEISFERAVYFCIGAYALQHVGVKLNVILRILLSIVFECDLIWPYFIVMPLFYVYAYFAYARKVSKTGLRYSSGTQIFMSWVLLLVCVYMSLRFDWAFSGENFPVFFAFLFCDLFATMLILIIQYFYYDMVREKREKESIETALFFEKRQYEAMNELIERINIKSHDLKHQLMNMGGQISEDAKAEILQSVSLYDKAYYTGSTALDTVLTQKKETFDQYGILLTCMADAAQLDFISPSEQYSLFGNLLDNAIEAAKDLDEDRRYCVLSVGEKAGSIVIHEENEYAGRILMQNGLPVTSKADTSLHGFGTKSIRLIVKNHGGTYAVSAKDGIYHTDILIPVPETK